MPQHQNSKRKKVKPRNLSIRQNTVIYNTKTLFDDNTTFRFPDYLLPILSENNKTLILKHKNKVLCIYKFEELKNNIITVTGTSYVGSHQGKEVEYNLVVIKLKDDGCRNN